MTAAFVPSSFAAERTANAVSQLSMVPPPSFDVPSVLLLSSTDVASTSFEPVLPETTTLVGFGIVLALCIVASSVWSNDVVPVSRSKLAISKSRGDVKEYLDELKEGGSDDDRKVEQWLFTDWLQENKSAKAPAIPILKKAKWNSGDNPVVVTAAIMMVGIVVASVTERVF